MIGWRESPGSCVWALKIYGGEGILVGAEETTHEKLILLFSVFGTSPV
jgi:hypothetical protein